jgi:uncharacterized protein
MSKSIIVRNLSFKTKPEGTRKSLQVDPLAVAFYSALSAAFPHGEAFFVRSVAHFSKQLPPALKVEVDAFVRQEALHSREHAHFNDGIGQAGLPVEAMIARATRQIQSVERECPIKRLAATVALEHFTSVFAEKILSDPRHLSHYEGEALALWQWHGVEEIEHKAVAMDVLNHITAHWSPVARWLCRTSAMLEVLARLGYAVWSGFSDVLAAEGLRTPGWRRRVLAFLFVKPGLLSAMLPEVLRFFAFGFHPNQKDESALLAQAKVRLEMSPA